MGQQVIQINAFDPVSIRVCMYRYVHVCITQLRMYVTTPIIKLIVVLSVNQSGFTVLIYSTYVYTVFHIVG